MPCWKSADSPLPNEAASVETAPLEKERAGPAPGPESQKPVLCMAGRSLLDEAAAALLAQILGKQGIEVKVEPAGGSAVAGSRTSRPMACGSCASHTSMPI